MLVLAPKPPPNAGVVEVVPPNKGVPVVAGAPKAEGVGLAAPKADVELPKPPNVC